MYRSFFKRAVDFTAALVGFLILSPIFIVTAAALALANKGTPFFLQARPGKNEKIFSIIKFKSMTDERDDQGNLLPDKDRLTRVGAFVRKTSLDEIPQLINVIIGDMSLIGPRPLLVEYLPYYTEREKLRHSVRPGITGLAQVNGRNQTTWDQRLNYDVIYAENLSLLLDLKIFVQTISSVMKREGVEVVPSTKYGKLNNERDISAQGDRKNGL